MKLALLAAPIALCAALALPSPAHADTYLDNTFIVALLNAGITVGDPDQAIANAHVICQDKANGLTPWRAVGQIDSMEPGIDYLGALAFVATAISTYCPEGAPSGSSSVFVA